MMYPTFVDAAIVLQIRILETPEGGRTEVARQAQKALNVMFPQRPFEGLKIPVDTITGETDLEVLHRISAHVVTGASHISSEVGAGDSEWEYFKPVDATAGLARSSSDADPDSSDKEAHPLMTVGDGQGEYYCMQPNGRMKCYCEHTLIDKETSTAIELVTESGDVRVAVTATLTFDVPVAEGK